MKQSDLVGVLFVCLGNICRSPLAEGVFRHLVDARGLGSRFKIDSAGTSGYHDGDAPDPRTSAVARKRGIELGGRSRKLTRSDLDAFDYVMVMDAENRAAVAELAAGSAPHAQVRQLREFDPEANGNLDVPDPYYGGTRAFEDVQDMVERACNALLDHIVDQRKW